MDRKGCWPQSFAYGRRQRSSGALFISNDWLESSSHDNPRHAPAKNCSRWCKDCLACVPEDNAGDGCAPIDAGNIGTLPFSRSVATVKQRQARNDYGGTPIETFVPCAHSCAMRCRIFLPSFATRMCREPRIMLKAERTAVSRNSCIGIEGFHKTENRGW